MCGFCNVWVCVCVDFVMIGSMYLWVLNVWVCVCASFVIFDCVYMRVL